MPKTTLTPKQELEIVKDYTENNLGIIPICEKFHIGKVKVKSILLKYDIPLNNRGKQPLKIDFKVKDFKIKKYINTDKVIFIAYDEKTSFESSDIDNNGGTLTTYINKEYGVEIPTLYDRRMYYMTTGNYWWEQWLKVKSIEKKQVKKCPYCNWETIDTENKSGAFKIHLLNVHNLTIDNHLKNYSDDTIYFNNDVKKIEKRKLLQNKKGFVICPICNKRFIRISEYHIRNKHQMSWENFRKKYPDIQILSTIERDKATENVKKGNLVVSKNRFISKYEKELQDFLKFYNIEFDSNRQILIGKEIDILIEKYKLGIEFNGLKFHTEFFGKKDKNYHLNKTIKCNEKGYKLIHIFEDEYVNKKEIVYSKLKHLLHLDFNLERIYARKCIIKVINKYDAEIFLNQYHIQGFSSGTVYLGAFYNQKLIGVMIFKKGNIKNYGWELIRFATDSNYICCGIGGKLFKFFIRNYNPFQVTSFADRRWTTDIYNNIYTKLGFDIVSINKPDYKYYNEKIDKYKRFHKMTLSKKQLLTKYDINPNLTELEMAKSLGYDRIWDCGLIKYVYINTDYNEKGE